MSTDYGFFCQTCNKAVTFEYLGDYATFDALKSAKELADLCKAMLNIQKSKCDEITLEAYWCQDVSKLVKFFGEHEDHKIFVCDEYGWTYDTETEERHTPSLIQDEDIWSILET